MTQNAFDTSSTKDRCYELRQRILEISQKVSALHIAPAFSCLEMVDVAYRYLLRKGDDSKFKDSFILSKGHGSLALYVVLESLGIISKDMLDNYSKPGWPLATHPDYGNPGIEASTGSLGHGLGLAVGMAYADKMKKIDRVNYLVLSDGEVMEGSVWEALMVAPSFGLKNLVIMIDNNDFISLGTPSKDLPNFYPLVEKFQAFGWESREVNGHDSKAVYDAVMSRSGEKPFALVGKTVKGKGVKFMEGVPIWHYRSPNPEEYKVALQQLEEVYRS
jgi:transketolase